MSQLDRIVNRAVPAEPWVEGDNIPWDDPEFSTAMLEEHLDQSHDLASRRTDLIDAQVAFIHEEILAGAPSRILDLACGPGLYASRLAELGHSYVGIDFSPAAIDHARITTPGAEFIEADVRTVPFPRGFDLILMLFGQINVFRRGEAADIVARALTALEPDGHLLLEAQAGDHLRTAGQAPPTWTAQSSGLFSPRPHLLLTESFWNEATRTATERFFVVDAATAAVRRHVMSTEAYTNEEFAELLTSYEDVQITADEPAWPQDDALVLVRGCKPR